MMLRFVRCFYDNLWLVGLSKSLLNATKCPPFETDLCILITYFLPIIRTNPGSRSSLVTNNNVRPWKWNKSSTLKRRSFSIKWSLEEDLCWIKHMDWQCTAIYFSDINVISFINVYKHIYLYKYIIIIFFVMYGKE